MQPSGLIRLNPHKLCKKSQSLFDFLSKRIINQQRAIQCIVDAYDRYLSPLWKPDRPIFCGLFPGPSGVGKTYIVETLAEYFFENPKAFTKIDCANYKERHEVSKLIGAPPGYIGYDDVSDPKTAQSCAAGPE